MIFHQYHKQQVLKLKQRVVQLVQDKMVEQLFLAMLMFLLHNMLQA